MSAIVLIVDGESGLSCRGKINKGFGQLGEYQATLTYAIDELTVFGGIVYRCIQAGTGNQPNTSPTFWLGVLGDEIVRTEVTGDITTDMNTSIGTHQFIFGVTDTTMVRTVTLATADLTNPKIVIVKDESGGAETNDIVVDTEGGETIDGSLSISILVGYGILKLYTDGSNWFTK